MLLRCEFTYRRGVPGDELLLGVFATQVFLDTYATNGINSDLAHEAVSVYSVEALAARIHDPRAEIIIAESNGYVVAFLDLSFDRACPVPRISGPEVLRLYVQAPFQRRGLGRTLLKQAEVGARAAGAPFIWLTAWSGNSGALAFYLAAGFHDVGVTEYVIGGKSYENRVFAKALATSAA